MFKKDIRHECCICQKEKCILGKKATTLISVNVGVIRMQIWKKFFFSKTKFAAFFSEWTLDGHANDVMSNFFEDNTIFLRWSYFFAKILFVRELLPNFASPIKNNVFLSLCLSDMLWIFLSGLCWKMSVKVFRLYIDKARLFAFFYN